MDDSKKKWILNKLVPSLIFFGVIGGVIAYIEWERSFLEVNHRFTIGGASKTFWTVGSGKQLLYEYDVNGKHYKSSNSYNDSCRVPYRYYVKFSVKNPDFSEILQNRPVPDSIINPPDEGWEKIPGE